MTNKHKVGTWVENHEFTMFFFEILAPEGSSKHPASEPEPESESKAEPGNY